MRVLLVLASVLALPVLEAWLLFRLGERFGVWVLVWLVAAALCGGFLIRFEKLVWAIRLAGSLREQRSPFAALLASARSLVAGLLLIFPGIITDLMALVILIWPLPKGGLRSSTPSDARPDAIEGEYRRETRIERLPPNP